MVMIRLARKGAKKQPYYHIVVSDVRMPQTGRSIERIGFFNPVARGGEERLRVDLDRVAHWQGHGALMTERVAALVKSYRKQAEQAEAA